MDLEKETEQQEAIEKKTETDGIETAVEKSSCKYKKPYDFKIEKLFF